MCCIQYVRLSRRQKLSEKWIFYDTEIIGTRYDLIVALGDLIPANAVDDVASILKKHEIELRIETPRDESLGYCLFHSKVIGINNNLSKERTLYVFIHELAHLLTHDSFPKAAVHGQEFYYCFQELTLKFMERNIISSEMFLPIVNRSGDYEFIKKHFGFVFRLKSIRVGKQFLFNNQHYVRGKGQQGQINCKKLTDNETVKLNPDVLVLPALDLDW